MRDMRESIKEDELEQMIYYRIQSIVDKVIMYNIDSKDIGYPIYSMVWMGIRARVQNKTTRAIGLERLLLV